MAILVSGWLISKKYSILKSHGQMNQDLADSIYGMSSIKLANFISIGQNTCSTWEIPVSVWLKFKHSASLKLGGRMNVHFARMMNGISCTK
jgi:hypothetical protein